MTEENLIIDISSSVIKNYISEVEQKTLDQKYEEIRECFLKLQLLFKEVNHPRAIKLRKILSEMSLYGS